MKFSLCLSFKNVMISLRDLGSSQYFKVEAILSIISTCPVTCPLTCWVTCPLTCWVSFDFPDLSVTPGSTYYIVARTGGSSYSQCYKIGFALGDPYALGSLWYSGNAGSNWLEYAMYDFCFKTYGT